MGLLVAAEEIAPLRLWSMGESSRANPKLHVGSCMYIENENVFQEDIVATLISKILGNGGYQVREASQHLDASEIESGRMHMNMKEDFFMEDFSFALE